MPYRLARGQEIKILPKHPWAGEFAKILGYENVQGSQCLRAVLISGLPGQEIFVFEPSEIQPIEPIKRELFE